ncbi:MAG: hypothetical protein ACT4P6_02320 [Gemmatimonadaceae bacterium]
MRRLLSILCILGALPNAALSQSRDSLKGPGAAVPSAAPPACCAIVRIEAAKSLVTARETATGFTFRFAVKNKRLLGTLKIGQPVWADFAGKTVKLKATDATHCCGIIETPPTRDTDSLGSALRVPPNADHQ